MPYFALAIAAVGYAVAGVATWRHLRADAPIWPAHAAAALAMALHILLLGHDMLAARSVVIGVGGALSLFAWQSALLLLLFSLRQPLGFMGLFVYPIAGICALVGAAIPDGNRAVEPLAWPLQTHIVLSLLAYGLLTLGAVQALAMAVQHRKLHDHRPRGLIATLPPLQAMEEMLFRLIGAGFFVLTLAIVSGFAFVDNLFAQHLAHKTVLSLLAWLVFGVLLWGRRSFGWRGRVAMRWALGGYTLLILAYFGSKLVLELILGRHW